MDNVKIISDRFIIGSSHLHDNLDSYVSWMRDTVNNQYILTARNDYSIEELIDFINGNNCSPQEILLGIFAENLKHVGNVRYSNINQDRRSAEVGFLIGDLQFRGLGVAEEVFLCSMQWLKTHLQMKAIYLGVDPQNIPAMNLYKKLGFSRTGSMVPIHKGLRMKLEF